MDEARAIAVSPRHTVLLAVELFPLVEKPAKQDFVVRTRARREANGLPLSSAEMVRSRARRRNRTYPAADTFPLHFSQDVLPRKVARGSAAGIRTAPARASELCATPPPIGYASNGFRSCLVPGQSYARLTPFGGEPPENNIAKAQKLPLATAAGLWRLAEETLGQLLLLHEGGLAHGDAELHNIIVCPAPLEPILIDFEAAVLRETTEPAAWAARCELDLQPLLREAVYLQCVLGRQSSRLGELSWGAGWLSSFKSPDRFRRAIDERAEV